MQPGSARRGPGTPCYCSEGSARTPAPSSPLPSLRPFLPYRPEALRLCLLSKACEVVMPVPMCVEGLEGPARGFVPNHKVAGFCSLCLNLPGA